jgi:photosystem II stability/assembly factor-like uncharacterized protein
MFGQVVTAVSVDPRDADHWFFTDSFGMYETRDAGKNWTLRMDGVEVTCIHVLCQDPADAGRVHLGMADNGYLNSKDGGASFQWKNMCSNVKDIQVSPKLPARVYALGTGTWDWASNQLFVSIDGGQNWSRSPMTGLPDMKKARCNTIAVNPDDPYECFLAVSGDVKPGGGGPYRSTDGGRSWQWLGAGLPQNAALFPSSIWIAGRQIATGAGGAVACVGNGGLHTLDRATMQWARLASVSVPNAIVGHPSEPGVWIISGNSGLYRFADGSLSIVYQGKATHLAADLATAGRFAASAQEGIVISTDSGKTWSLLDQELPLGLAYNALAFAGNRLVAGSGGSGVFWIPLIRSAANSCAARPVAPAPARPDAAKVPALHNLDFSAGEEYPASWNRPWSGRGKVLAARDTTVLLGGRPTLCLQSDTPGSHGNVSQNFTPTDDEFTLSGTLRLESKTEGVVAVQVYDGAGKQIAWINAAVVKEAVDAKEFTAAIKLPATAAKAVLILMIQGDGRAWFGNLRVTPSPSVFR